MSEESLFSTTISNYFAPMILFFFNYIFIPFVVDWISYYEEYELKSIRHKRNLFRQYLFMIINTLFIPITGMTTI